MYSYDTSAGMGRSLWCRTPSLIEKYRYFWQNLYVGRLIDLGPDRDPAAEDYVVKRKNVDWVATERCDN